MKRILGLDLGTTSIGWAIVDEAEKESEQSSIIKTGVRVVPLSTDEQINFEKGQSITINANRTEKRGGRRNKFRFKLRRKALIKALKKNGFIKNATILTEDDKNSTHKTYEFRAKAVHKKIEKEQLVRVLLMINKKRGYKSSRKANNAEEGELIDGMEVAKKLNNQNLTPGQFTLHLLEKNKKTLPDYYRSDLQQEFDKIWDIQKRYYPEILTKDLKENFSNKNKGQTWKICQEPFGIVGIKQQGSTQEKKIEVYQWRNNALKDKLELEELAVVFSEINNQINKSSGYLGEISDRSKELYFNNQTVGEYQWKQLKNDPHTSLKNQVFYRQDYDDEFEAIWNEQSKHYSELTEEFKKEIKDTIIFYQRPLKSQKGLISYCEFESWEQEVTIDGETKKKTVGHRVVPKSSPLFQQFKIWQNINSLRIENIKTGEIKILEEETKKELFSELNWEERWTPTDFFKWIDLKEKDWKINFQHLEGNRTNHQLLKAYKKIASLEGYNAIDYKKLSKTEVISAVKECFKIIVINASILEFDPIQTGNTFAKQPSYQLWHLLYSYEDDYSPTGNASLIEKLKQNFGFKVEHATLLANVTFQDDYGNLSARAIKKIYPHLEDGLEYSEACTMAGYNHSSAITKKQNDERELSDKLEILKKNSLRNPVVEKILNQMINVVNAILEDENLGRPDEIRIEMARELKKTAKQRSEMTTSIAKATREHEEYRKIIKKEFGLPYVSRNDLIKYKLYKELEPNKFHTIYSNTYIAPDKLFSKDFDVEHIIPKARLFDDSFSNKTLETRHDNIDKGNETALDYVQRKYGDKAVEEYRNRLENLFKAGKINYTKRKKLLMKIEDIPEDFLARDLGTSAYIARASASILLDITKKVTLTSGTITATLREDWGLVKVLQELNWDKYDKVGLTYYDINKNGKKLKRIKDWTKRNDHRHHAMDAITVAFTKPALIQYLNNKNADSKKGIIVQNIKEKYTYKNERGKRKFITPFENIREKTKEHLESILVSYKAKNKVTTKNKNKIKLKGKNNFKVKIEETPRGKLHMETVYGKSKYYATKLEKIGGKFDAEKINQVANEKYRNALLQRLRDFDDNPKKAFTAKNSLTKNPIYINGTQETVPETVKLVWMEDQFTIRKNITPDLKIDKVTDVGVRRILEKRLKEFGGKPKEAFVNLTENPIWLNKEKRIQLKSVTITGVSNAESLHVAKDHLGKEIKDKNGDNVPVDFVELGNNHHIAIYKNSKGELKEDVVSFFQAVIRKNQGDDIIKAINKNGWSLHFTMKQNEMFIFPTNEFTPSDINLLDINNKETISKHLFRVQSISSKYYIFRHHLETTVANGNTFKNQKMLWGNTFQFIRTEKNLQGIIKVRINHLGNIVQIGEY